MAATDAERQAARRSRLMYRLGELDGENIRLSRALEDAQRDLEARDAEIERLSSGGLVICATCRTELACPRCYRADDF